MDGWNNPMGSDHFNYNGPCEQPPSPFTLTYDGVLWEEDWNHEEFDNCDEDADGDGYECWNEDWDWTNHYED